LEHANTVSGHTEAQMKKSTLSYIIVVVQESRGCVVSVTGEAQFMSSSRLNGVVSVSCGSKSHPWRLEAAAGQRINISLLDFTADDRPRDRVTCTRQYGYVLENKRNVSVCAGRQRQSHLLVSQSNTVHIVQTPDSEHSFLIKVEGRCILVFVIMFAYVSHS